MCVALPRGVLILSDIFIIYLAAAAPFGVSRFLSEHAGGADAPTALFRAACAALAWPLASLPRLVGRAASRRRADDKPSADAVQEEQRVERAKRAAVNALRSLEDLLEDAHARDGGAGRFALFAAREGVERYAGLSLAASQVNPGARPTAREMELCRIAGRGGDDLLTAGRCVHRRNVTRLVAHRERAGAELTQALSAVCKLAREARPGRDFEEHLRAGGVERVALDAVPVSEALVFALSRVAELTALFGDRASADGVARLLDEERARRAGAADNEGGSSCTTQAVPTAFAGPRLRTTTSHGG